MYVYEQEISKGYAWVKVKLTGYTGMKINAANGQEELGFPDTMSTLLFYPAQPGDRLTLLDESYNYAVATYAPEIDPRWIYTYTYAPDQGWVQYRHDLTETNCRQGEYIFNESVYFRLCLRKVNGGDFTGTEDINDIIIFETQALPQPQKTKPWIQQEVRRVSERVSALRTDEDLAFILMTDTHHNVNGTWQDTKQALTLLNQSLSIDGIIHLGDFTDGMVTKDALRHYMKEIKADLEAYGVPLWTVIGNHDVNYFKNNPQRLTIEEQREIYTDIRYYIDFPQIRLIFLDSFDPDASGRYGYHPECIAWLSQTLESLPHGYKALIFSHLSPITRLQFWAKHVRGEAELMATIIGHKSKILGWINGHNHADHIDNDEGIPIISIANAKCEAFTEYKPEGSITPERKWDDVSQELWDVMLVNPQTGTLRFVRFGAGKDKKITNGRVSQLTDLQTVQLTLLKEFIRVAEEEALQWYVMFGTLLGTTRTGGFIPWDDDIDIVLPRPEYNRLRNLHHKFHAPYFLQTTANDPAGAPRFTRLKHDETAVIYNFPTMYTRRGHMGVYIDIIPLDIVPNYKTAIKMQELRPRFHGPMYYSAALDENEGEEVPDFKESACIAAGGIPGFYQFFADSYERFCAHHTEGHYYSMPVLNGAHGYRVYDRKWFESGEEMEFEGLKVRVPIGWREILVATYPEGLYEPELLLRKSKNQTENRIVDTKRSYKEYVRPYTDMLCGIEGKRVYLFGAGDSLRIWLERYAKGLNVVCAFDNSQDKWGTNLFGVYVKNPAELPHHITEGDRLIITSIYHKEIIEQLKGMEITDYYVFIDGLKYRWERM